MMDNFVDPFIEELERSPEGYTFSNSTEYEMFLNSQCSGCVFEEDCVLPDVAIFGHVPVDWVRTETFGFECSRRVCND
jgi:hypothetical protein